MEFCKAFNAQTQKEEKIPRYGGDHDLRRSFVHLRTAYSAMSFFIKKAAKLTSGSKLPGRDKAGR